MSLCVRQCGISFDDNTRERAPERPPIATNGQLQPADGPGALTTPRHGYTETVKETTNVREVVRKSAQDPLSAQDPSYTSNGSNITEPLKLQELVQTELDLKLLSHTDQIIEKVMQAVEAQMARR